MDKKPLDDLNFSFAPAADTVQVEASVEDTLKLLHNSAAFFINFFLGDRLTFPVPQFHEKAWEYLVQRDIERIALALPRGHAKTTLAKLAVVWYFLFTDFRFIVYVSNTATIAAEACQDIINFMLSPNYLALFGNLEFHTRQEAHGFYKFYMRFVDQNGVLREKLCILRSFGAGQQVRGLNIDNKRPEMGVVDDLEDDDNTATVMLIRKLRVWFFGPFLKAFSKPKFKLIFLGNMLSSQSLLYHFCEHSDEWHSMRLGCIGSDGSVLWPDVWPLEKIKSDFIEYQRIGLAGRWFAEMMNMPIADGNLLISSDEIYYVPELVPGEQEMSFITVDCAISQKTWADSTAVVVHAFKNGLWRVVDYIKGKFSPDQIFWLLVEFSKKWRTRAVGIQQAPFEQALKFLFDVLMVTHNQKFEIFPLPHNNASKLERIAVWCSLIRKKQWAVNEGEYSITEQLLMFDPAKKNNEDDLIDACAMGPTMTDLYLIAIMDACEPDKERYTITRGYQVCRI